MDCDRGDRLFQIDNSTTNGSAKINRVSNDSPRKLRSRLRAFVVAESRRFWAESFKFLAEIFSLVCILV